MKKQQIGGLEMFEELFREARKNYDQGEYVAAIAKLTQIIDSDSKNGRKKSASAYQLRGLSYIKMNDNYEAAEKDFQTALELEPENPYILSDMGCLEHKKGNYREAVSFFDRAIELNPDNYITYLNKVYTLERSQKYREALDILPVICNLRENKGLGEDPEITKMRLWFEKQIELDGRIS